jgi:hypothetical protein
LIQAPFRAILRRPMPPRLAALLTLVLAAACGSPCQDLGERICKCQPAGTAQDGCKQAVEDQIDRGNPRPGDSEQDRCEELLKTCPDPANDAGACDRLATEEGRVACGLGYGEPAAAPAAAR